MEEGKRDFVKVSFALPPGGEYTRELLWASKVQDNIYCVENSPFSIHGISYKDLILTRCTDGELQFDRLYKKSNHSTYRFILKKEEYIGEILKKILISGVTYESSKKQNKLYVIDIPDKNDVLSVYRSLESFENSGWLVFEEADY